MEIIKSVYWGTEDLLNYIFLCFETNHKTSQTFCENWIIFQISSIPFQCNVASITAIIKWGLCSGVTKPKYFILQPEKVRYHI